MRLNKETYEVGKDNLVYDGSHPFDGATVKITVPVGSVGTIQRGQVLDFADGAYTLHAEGGAVSVIVSVSTPYAADDTEVTVPVYFSGTFRKSACITDSELTITDVETFRSKGIYLK